LLGFIAAEGAVAISNKVAMAACAAALVACIVSVAVEAQTSPKDTIIRLRYVTVEDRLRPDPKSGLNVERTIVLWLSVGGEITESYGRTSGRWRANSDMAGRLGGKEIAGPSWNPAFGRVRWHVINANTVVRVRELEQSIQTITVRINGSTCEMMFDDRLKPGFAEVKNMRINGSGVAYFSLARASETSCSIE
jgi:hypothetical protein